MKDRTVHNLTSCPRQEIAAYLDGDLDARQELSLEQHFAVCPVCLEELNQQKKLLCALDFALEDKEKIQLPVNFTKVVITNAESCVKGLRCPRERNRALWICTALFLLIVMGLGAETFKAFGMLETAADRTIIVGSFLVRLVSDLTIAMGVILRSICLQFIFKSASAALLSGFFILFSVYIFSRLLSRQNKT